MANSEIKKAKADNITYNVMLSDRANKDGTFNLYLRITQNRKHRKLKLDIRLEKARYFLKKAKYGKWITEHPKAKAYNDSIEQEIEKAKQHQRDIKKSGIATPEVIISRIAGSDSDSFFQYANMRAQYFYDSGGYRNYKKYKSFISKLQAYLKGKDLTFAEITLKLITGFESYLKKQPNSRQPQFMLHKNTVARHLIVFRSIVNEAINNGLMNAADNPFLVHRPKETKTTKEKLTAEEIDVLNGLELAKYSPMWHSRNYFMFSFYCAGIRAGDLMSLKWNSISKAGRLGYQMSKTKQTKSIKLQPKALEILKFYKRKASKANEYIFPLLNNAAPYAIAGNEQERASLPADIQVMMYKDISAKNAAINKQLKKLAELAGISKKISFHISRHSFSNIARQKGISVYDVSKMLGHSSIKITETYLQEFDSESMDESMERIFE